MHPLAPLIDIHNAISIDETMPIKNNITQSQTIKLKEHLSSIVELSIQQANLGYRGNLDSLPGLVDMLYAISTIVRYADIDGDSLRYNKILAKSISTALGQLEDTEKAVQKLQLRSNQHQIDSESLKALKIKLVKLHDIENTLMPLFQKPILKPAITSSDAVVTLCPPSSHCAEEVIETLQSATQYDKGLTDISESPDIPDEIYGTVVC